MFVYYNSNEDKEILNLKGGYTKMPAYKVLEENFIQLPPDLQKEGMDFIDFLLKK